MRSKTDWVCVAVWLGALGFCWGFWVLVFWGLGEAMRAWAL